MLLVVPLLRFEAENGFLYQTTYMILKPLRTDLDLEIELSRREMQETTRRTRELRFGEV